MAWTDTLGKIAKGVVDYTGIPGLIHDMSNTLSNEDPWYVDGMNLVKDVAKIGTTPVRGAVKGLLYAGEKSYEAGGVVRRKMEETLLDTPLMYNKFKNPNETFDAYRSRVAANKDQISLGQATLSVLSPGKNAAERSGWFADALDNNLKFLSAGFDLFDPEDRKIAFDDQYTGKFLSGVNDLVSSTIIDPLTFTGFLGKGAVIASKGLMAENITGKAAKVVFGKVAMTHDSMDNLLTRALKGEGAAVKDVKFLAETDAKGQFGYWANKKVTNPDALAYMFGKVTDEKDVVTLFRALINKEPKAMSEIAEKDSEFALMLDGTNDVSHVHKQLLDGKLDGDVLDSAEYNKAVSSYIEDLKTSDPSFQEAYNKVSSGRPFRYGFEKEFLQKSRFGSVNKSQKAAARTFAEPETVSFLKTSLHPLIQVGHFFSEDVPSGIFNVNDGNSYMEFNTFLRQTNDLSKGKFREASREFADRYLAAAMPNDRLDIIKEAERSAVKTLFPNYDQDTLDRIYKIYDSRRSSLIERHKNQGFLGYFQGDQFINMKSPLLERQGANAVVIMDLARLKHGIDAHERILPTLLQGIDVDNLSIRTQKSVAALDTINDIFKTSVLMRFGYTMRNLTEAQLSIMAKGFALPSMVAANGKEGVARFFNNRKVGVNRLADHVGVLAGRKDDYGVLQHEIASQIDMLRSTAMGRQQLAKAVSQRLGEIRNEKFRLRLTGDVAPLNLDDEIKTLTSVLADLNSKTIYHGAEASFKLDPTRSLAGSGSFNVAKNYTGDGTLHGIEQYIETPSGKPGRIGQKPTSKTGELKPLVEQDEIKRLNPNMSSSLGNMHDAGLVKTDFVKKFIEFDRTNIAEASGDSAAIIAKITEDLKSGKGFTDPLILAYYVDDNGKLLLKLTEGNHRIQAALNANIDFVPIKIVKGYKSEKNLKPTGIDSPIKPDKMGYIPGNPNPRTLLPAKAMKDLRVFLKEPTTKRAATLEGAKDNLLSAMIEAKNAGKKVEFYDNKTRKWDEVDSLTMDNIILAEGGELQFKLQDFKRAIFRVDGNTGKVKNYQVFGAPLDMQKWSNLPIELREAAFAGKESNYRKWVKAKGWSNQDDPVYKYMRDNEHGYAVVPDDVARAGGASMVALPEALGESGRTKEADRIIRKMMAETEGAVLPQEQLLSEPAERRGALKKFNRKARLQKQEYAVSPYYTKDNVHAMINNGVEDAAANLFRAEAEARNHLDDLMSRMGAVTTRSETNSIKQRIGFGTMSVDLGGNHSYELPKAFENASWYMGRTSAEQTWNALVSSQEMAFTAGIGSRTVRTIQPSDPKYFEGWANILNMHFRDPETGIMDPVVRMILDNQDNKKILGWLRTHEGDMYAREAYTLVGEKKGPTRLSGGELEEHLLSKLEETRNAVAAYIPDNDTALMLSAAKENGKPLSGGDVQQFLLERFGKNPEALKPLNGMLITSSKEYKDQERLIDTINRRVMRFLGSMPEDVFARHPLVNQVYEKELRLNIAAMADAKGADKLTPDEVNRAVKSAREFARQEVERTLFTIVRRTGASSSQSMKLLFPFFAAYENTLKRWGGMAMDNPMIPATAARTIAQVVNSQMIVDRDGNRITSAEQLQGNQQTANLVVQVPQQFIDALPKGWQEVVQNSFKNVNIPLSSLDVITQGNPGNPGFGPYATLPAYLVLQQRPELENALQPFFPVGMPQSATDIFTPSVIRRLRTVWSQDELYVRSYNQMLRYETYLYNQGKRQDAPLPSEIESKTNKFFFLRALTSISAPFAIAPEIDFYAQTFRALQAQYADYVNPQTGKREYGMAEAKFLEQYPDFFEATVSLSKNEGGLEPSIQTVRNLKKHSDLMALAAGKGDPELMGFLANDGDEQYTFSQAAYQWQYNHGATPGAGSAYRQNRTPGDLQKEANIKRGWTEFQQLQAVIKAYQFQNGIESDSDPAMAVVKDAKSLWVQQKAQEKIDWYSEYISPDRAKYERRAQILTTATKDKAWMAQNGDRPVVKNMALYLETRKVISQLLKERDAAGGSRSMDAKSNADIAEAFQLFRDNLIVGSNETEQFLNRYFANDTVVL